jgi:hypothetical protein
VLHRRGDEAYVHFLNTDRRLDEWVPESQLRVAEPHEIIEPVDPRGKKRKRVLSHHPGSPSASQNGAVPGESHDGVGVGMGHSGRSASPEGLESDEDSDTGEHLRLTAKRNFDRVNFGHWQIKTWYGDLLRTFRRSTDLLASGTSHHTPSPSLSRRKGPHPSRPTLSPLLARPRSNVYKAACRVRHFVPMVALPTSSLAD